MLSRLLAPMTETVYAALRIVVGPAVRLPRSAEDLRRPDRIPAAGGIAAVDRRRDRAGDRAV